jgi:hypothetical protein
LGHFSCIFTHLRFIKKQKNARLKNGNGVGDAIPARKTADCRKFARNIRRTASSEKEREKQTKSNVFNTKSVSQKMESKKYPNTMTPAFFFFFFFHSIRLGTNVS